MFRKIRRILYRSIDNKEISYDVLKKLAKDNEVMLIDVRSNQEYEEGHLNGAKNISVYNLKNEIEDLEGNKDKLIILYCSSGHRSKKAKEILDNLGYTNVYNLKNGIDDLWIKG